MSEAPAAFSKPVVMGVLNVTPDSFSDGGRYLDAEAALAHARELVAQGADIIDVGGESTRPGARRVAPEEERRRVMPVVSALAAEGIAVSIDTVRAETARLAVDAGASLINDVSGGTADPEMLRVAADSGARLVLMHWRGIPDPGHARSRYTDVVEEVRSELGALAGAAIAAGVAPEKIVLDPGLGFDKTTEQGWLLLRGASRLASLGYPLLVGVSRKRMLGETLRETVRETLRETVRETLRETPSADLGAGQTMADRDLATAVVSALAARSGVWGVRVHDVASTVTALAVAEAWGTPASASPLTPASPLATPATPATPSSSTESGTCCGLKGLEVATSDGLLKKNRSDAELDRITLTGLEVFAHHGVFDFEREQGQRFVIDVEVVVDMRAAAAGDDLARTVNYAELAGAILADAAANPVDLIETLAERLADVALGFAGVYEARLTVHKPDAPIDARFADVSVSITRRREGRP